MAYPNTKQTRRSPTRRTTSALAVAGGVAPGTERAPRA